MSIEDIDKQIQELQAKRAIELKSEKKEKIGKMLFKDVKSSSLAQQRNHPHDVPGDWFTGPF
jgi:hypothetical protein